MEILVVIAILGILAVVAIPNLVSLQDSGREEAAKTELAIVQTAVAAYMVTSGNCTAPDACVGAVAGKHYLDVYLLTDLCGEYTITDCFVRLDSYPGLSQTEIDAINTE